MYTGMSFEGHAVAMDDRTHKMGTRKTATCAPSTPSTASSASRFEIAYWFSGFGCADGT